MVSKFIFTALKHRLFSLIKSRWLISVDNSYVWNIYWLQKWLKLRTKAHSLSESKNFYRRFADFFKVYNKSVNLRLIFYFNRADYQSIAVVYFLFFSYFLRIYVVKITNGTQVVYQKLNQALLPSFSKNIFICSFINSQKLLENSFPFINSAFRKMK